MGLVLPATEMVLLNNKLPLMKERETVPTLLIFLQVVPTPRKHLLMALFMVQAQAILIVAIASNQK